MPNGFLDVTVKMFPNFSAFKIGVKPGMRPQPDLNRHTKALAIELQGHVRLAVCTTIVIICEVYRARSHRQVAAL